MQWDGCLTAAHGGYTTVGLLLSTAATVTATMYGVGSCRFLAVTFSSETGGFEEYFNNLRAQQSGQNVIRYKAGIGLFQWLRPFRALGEDWSEGSCAGYQESMRNEISNGFFEAARLFAVLAIIMAWVLFFWAMGMLCLRFNRIQTIAFAVCAGLGTIFASLTFLLLQSPLCQQTFVTRECTVDEGGLVMIAGLLLWTTTTVVAAIFLRPVDLLYEESNRPLTPDDKDKLAAELVRRRAESASRPLGAAAAAATTTRTSSSNHDVTTPETLRSNPANGTSPLSSSSSPAPKRRLYRPEETEEREQRQQQRREDKGSGRPTQNPNRTSQSAVHYRSKSGGGGTSDSMQVVARRPKAQPRQQQSVLVDDVSTQDEMEVYIAKRLDRIEALSEV